MATLISPGVSSYVSQDLSTYTSRAAGATVPLIFIATEANKTINATSTTIAAGTTEANVIRTVTSVKELVDLYGIPKFRSTINSGVALQQHGDVRNEYGLFAAYQFLANGGNQCYVVRAPVDLSDVPVRNNVLTKSISTVIAAPGNVGNGSIGTFRITQATAQDEQWTIAFVNSTVFTVTGTISGTQTNGTVGVAYTNGIIGFTVAAGLAPWTAGDMIQFNVISIPSYSGVGDGTITGNIVTNTADTIPTASNPGNLPSTSMIGNGTLSSITLTASAVAETWTVVAIDSSTFTVTGSASGAKANAIANIAYTNGLVSFKIFAGTTVFSAGDTFTFDVSSNTSIVDPKNSSLETWTIVNFSTTSFSVTGSITGFSGYATIGAAYNNGKIGFTISNGPTLFVLGDEFTFSVSQATSQDPLGPTHASKRVHIVQALQAAINSNEDVKSEQYEYNLLLCPGYPETIDELTQLNRAINEEAFIIADTPMDMNVEQTVAWSQTTGRQSNTYVGYYYPSGLASNIDGVDVMCAASGIALGIIAYSDKVSELWFAPAGLRRGQTVGISNIGYVVGSLGTPTTFVPLALNVGQRDTLYNIGKQINPIVFFPGRGIVVWGQKTSQSFSSAMDRINVVRLLCYIKRSLRKSLMPFVFEPSDVITWANVTTVVNSFLGDILTKRGLYDFVVLCNSSTNTPDVIDRNELVCWIGLKPTKAIEFVMIPISIYSTGATMPK